MIRLLKCLALTQSYTKKNNPVQRKWKVSQISFLTLFKSNCFFMANTLFEYDTVINADSLEAIPNSYEGRFCRMDITSRILPFWNISVR